MQTIGLVFPGQGSQTLGMLADIAEKYPEVVSTYSQASDVLGYDLWKLVQEGPIEQLNETIHTQPALLAGSVAIWEILKKQDKIVPALFAGHSLGEYSALVCAEALAFQDAIKLVAARGFYMQEAIPLGEGALAAIVGLSDATVTEICEAVRMGEVLAPVNFNSPGQVVIGGHTQAIKRALILAKEKGVKIAKLLPVSVPSHCILMKPAAEKIREVLATLPVKSPRIPVINNVDVIIYEDATSIREGLVRQLYQPVRWVETIQKFKNHGINYIIECGPGKVLTRLNKRIIADSQFSHTADLDNLTSVLHQGVF